MIETWFNQDVKRAVKVQYLDGNVFSMDNNGNRVGVCLLDGETETNVVGTISGEVIRVDGGTVSIVGSSSGNKAWVELPQAACAYPGLISIVIKATDSGNITTLCAVVANVYRTSTDTVIDPGTIIPDIATLVSEIETAVASIPADYSSLWATVAPVFSTNTSYSVGQYCTYNGELYRFTASHSGSWSSSDVVAVNVGGELYGVKRSLLVSQVVSSGTVNLNDYLTEGRYQFLTSVSFTNAPAYTRINYAHELQVISVNNGNAFMQIFTDFSQGNQYVRYYRTNTSEWNEWKEAGNGIIPLSSSIDFNNYINPGRLYLTEANYKASSNTPSGYINSFCVLDISVGENAVVIQKAEYPAAHMEYIRIRNIYNEWSAWSNIGGSVIVDSGSIDLNDYTGEGTHVFLVNVSSVSHKPLSSLGLPFILCVKNINNGTACYQQLIVPNKGLQYERYYTTGTGTWTDWNAIVTSIAFNVENESSVDFDNMTIPGTFYYAAAKVNTAANAPINTDDSFGLLTVIKETRSTGVIYQKLSLPLLNVSYTRRRSYTSEWSSWALESMPQLHVLFSEPYLSKLTFNGVKKRKNIQEIAVYNGHIFDFGTGVVSIDGGANINITNGHGNNAQFGVELHGDFPYLYCGSWNKNDCKVYVNQVTTTTATLVRTIEFSTLSGYLNMCVDEPNGRIYILQCTSDDTVTGDVDFVVADLSSGAIVSQTTLPYKIPVIQGMEFHNGIIYVTSGLISSNVTNHITLINTSGNIIQKSDPINVSELEGISFDNGNLYVADTGHIYY